jgi:prepilin-type N-terminal cleavage/methylation domain-containing protein
MKYLITTKKKISTEKGFTLIEIMVSISIFTIIMVSGIGALLTITRSYQASRDISTLSNSIHFAFDSLVRDIRIGDSYYSGSFSASTFPDEYRFNDGISTVINLIGSNQRGHLRYTFDTSGDEPILKRYQAVDGQPPTDYPMLTGFDNIDVTNTLFRVVGSDPADNIQPSVFIYLRGINTDDNSDFIIQTFVSQRSFDIQ